MRITVKSLSAVALAILFSSASMLSCTDQPELDSRASSKDNASDVSGGSSTGPALDITSECELIGGTIGCKTLYKGGLFKLNHSALNHQPTFDLYLDSQVSSSDIYTLETSEDPISLTTLTPNSSEYSLVFEFTDDVTNVKNVFDFFGRDESRSNSDVGMKLTIQGSQYSPESGKESIKLGRCMTGLILKSWLINDGSSTIFSNSIFRDEDYQYLTFIPFNTEMETIDAMSITNIEKWKLAFDGLISAYIDTPPTGMSEESFGCKTALNNLLAGEKPDTLEGFEDELSELLLHFLVDFHSVETSTLNEVSGN
ncbi:hypothetical protein N9W79_00430 [bacterium]|nr:hypothetical protein [bacterium]